MKYVSLKDTAVLVRKALAKAFPGVKFSVRGSSYAGGASIDVRWFDGPSAKAVNEILGPFESRGFDGMIDMAYCKRSWLEPDGTVHYGASSGTAGSMGCHGAYSHPAPSPDAEMVSFGANYVQGWRRLSLLGAESIASAFKERFARECPWKIDISGSDEYGWSIQLHWDPELGKWNDYLWMERELNELLSEPLAVPA